MLSALAKYIFGGVMGDAPETTPMQYETREINDWLLVDTPDQAIDDEDMDSEYDEDEILTAVPLLMDEESVIPRQIVLSYEANAICDNTCGKLRKDFHKLCPASSKGQVHHGDKIQGNCINNVEAISLKSGNGKLQDKLSEIKINSKSKKSRSRKNKPKNSKRSKVQSKIAAKSSDSSSTIKETYDDQYICKNSNDNKLNENVKKIESGDEIKTEFATDYDNSVAISKSSIDKIENPSEIFEVGDLNDMMEDSGDFVWKNFFNIPESFENKNVHEKAKTSELGDQNKIELVKGDHDNSFAILKNSSDKELSFCETFQKHVSKGILEDSEDFDLEAFFNEEYGQEKSKGKNFNEKSKKTVSLDLNKTVLSTEGNDNSLPKLKNYKDKIQTVSLDLNKSELSTEGNDNSLPKSKNSSDTIQSISDHFQKNNFSDILEGAESSAWKKICNSHSQSSSKQENIKRSSSDRTAIFKNYDEEFPEIDSGVLELFDEVCKKCDSQVKKDHDSKISTSLLNKKQNNFELKENSNKSKKCRSKKSKKCGFQDKFGKISSPIPENKKGLNSHDHTDSYAEKERKMQFASLETVEGKVNIFDRNASSNLQSILPAELQDDAIQGIFEDDSSECYTNAQAERLVTIKEDLRNEGLCGDEFKNVNSNAQKETNTGSLESYETILGSNAEELKFISQELQISSKYPDRNNMAQNSKAVYDSKNSVVDTIQGSMKRKNSTDNILDSFANFWDIYTKIQDVSDDELQEMLDDDMNRNSQKLQESLYRTINELEVTDDNFGEFSDDEMYEKPCHNVMGLWYSKTTNPCNSAFRLSPHQKTEEEQRRETGLDNQKCLILSPTKACKFDMGTSFIDLAKDCYDLLEELNQNETQISNHNTACVPYTEYELAEYFNSEPRCFYAYQTLQYPSNYALAIAEFYAKREHYYQECHSYPCYSECCDICIQNYEESFEEDDSSLSPIKARIITNSAELLQNLISQKSTILPKKTAVVLEHVKELKSVQQAIQFDTRRYLTRSQLNKQNRNYIYQCSVKTNRRKNLQRNHSGANNNRKCCY